MWQLGSEGALVHRPIAAPRAFRYCCCQPVTFARLTPLQAHSPGQLFRLGGEVGVAALRAQRGPYGDDYGHRAANKGEGEPVIVAVALRDSRLNPRVLRRDQVAELIGEAGEPAARVRRRKLVQ